VRPLLERNEPDAVVLALERPLAAGEALLSERRRHGFDPLWEIRGHVTVSWKGRRSAMTLDGTTETQTAKRNADGRGKSRDGSGYRGNPEHSRGLERNPFF